MNRETMNFFAEVPYVDKPRSKFEKPFKHLTSFNAGDCVVSYWDEVLPGDTINMKMSNVIRMSTPLYPTMQDCFVDHLFFFVPTRLLWSHWQAFWGENTNAWYQQVEYEVPQIITKQNIINGEESYTKTFAPKSIADYMGLPTNMIGLSVSALPFRGVVKIWNDWFRDENLQQEATLSLGDSNEDAGWESRLGGPLLKANKVSDYFTSCLPAPLKSGTQVLLPLGSWAPVKPLADEVTYATGENKNTLKWRGTATATTFDPTYKQLIKANVNSSDTNQLSSTIASPTESSTSTGAVYPSNLWADLKNATAATINEIRQAFAIQRFFEAQARGGSRYIEFLKNIFGVTSPDQRLQRSEYLGGKRIPIGIYQTTQTSSTDAVSPLGTTGAFGHMADSTEYFTKSFTEHGYVYCISVIRYKHVYSQSVERAWSRKKWTDFYVPQFANLGEQAVLNKEIYAQGTSADNEVFGYQEAWAGGYRYKPDITTSEMNPGYAQTLAAWHYADHYTQKPVLGSTWIAEDKTNIDRTLAVSSENADQFIADFYFNPTWIRVMPLYSVPGLIDHM